MEEGEAGDSTCSKNDRKTSRKGLQEEQYNPTLRS